MAGPEIKPNKQKNKKTGNLKKGRKRKSKPIDRGGMTPQQYYNAEIKIFQEQLDSKLQQIEFLQEQGHFDADQAEAQVEAAHKEFAKRKKGAVRRKGVPGADAEKTVEEKQNELSDMEDALLKRQTDQNFLLRNLLSFSSSKGKPNPSQLDKIIPVSAYGGNLINKMTSSRKLLPLMHATSLELSTLVPFFRLFKRNAKGILSEFQFTDRLTWKWREDPESELLDHNSSFGGGVGLKSFNWDTQGTNMFTAPRVLTAELNLHFQSVTDLERHASMDEEGPRWYELIVPAKRKSNPPVGCPTTDVTMNEAVAENLTEAQMAAMSQNEAVEDTVVNHDYSIMVEVGWKYGQNNTDLSPILKEAIDASRVVLNLTLVRHDFKFREDGSIDVNISYVARMDGIMNDYNANLLHLTEEGINTEIVAEIADLKNQIKTMKEHIDSPTGVVSCLEKDMTSKEKSPFKKQKEALRERILGLETEMAERTQDLKLSLYGKFMQFLIEKRRLFHVDVGLGDYAHGNLPVHWGAQVATVSSQRFIEVEGVDDFYQATDMALEDGVVTQAADIPGAIHTNDDDKKTVDAVLIKDRMNAKFGDCHPVKEGMKRVTYFYLGDLVNFYAGVLPPENNKADKFEIVLGDLQFLDYREIAKTEMRDTLRGTLDQTAATITNNSASAYRVQKNMALVPISLDMYGKWFIENVVNEGSVFSFKTFLENLISKLLIGALESLETEHVGRDLKRAMKEVNRVRGTIIQGSNGYLERGWINEEYLVGTESAHGIQDSNFLIKPHVPYINNATARFRDQTEYLIDNPANESRQFLVLYASRLPHHMQVVNEIENAKEGIYHLKIGADKGIVKNISLDREASKRIFDANIMRAYNHGGSGIGVLREPYNATVKCFGSGFFQPGQFVYINPVTTGLGSYQSRLTLANRLGFGGFYLITKVAHGLSEGMLETTLTCRFNSYGYRTPKEVPAQTTFKEVGLTTDEKHERHQNSKIAADALAALGLSSGKNEDMISIDSLSPQMKGLKAKQPKMDTWLRPRYTGPGREIIGVNRTHGLVGIEVEHNDGLGTMNPEGIAEGEEHRSDPDLLVNEDAPFYNNDDPFQGVNPEGQGGTPDVDKRPGSVSLGPQDGREGTLPGE